VRRWNLRDIETPAGKRSPVVLHSSEEARAVLVALEPGESLGDHQVKENEFVTVVDGTVRVEAGGDSVEAGAGELLAFEPDERRAISSTDGARLLLFLAPWPGEGHYRGEKAARSDT
jgi:quercetin dioxygenase-like cupin family protein